ncbi:hypothetical protein GW765_01360 [Candidatus Parcubacteria bacterium]|nr:hypothetical protein [Candidatus Parcubacteria bacterium]
MKKTEEQQYFKYFEEVLIALFPHETKKLRNASIYATSELTGLRIGDLIDKGVLLLSEYREAAEFAMSAKYKFDRDKIQDQIDHKYSEVHGVERVQSETEHIFSGEIRKDPIEKLLN